ncbi:hypothetical protein [Chitinimonas lacunae]|uniref:Histone deacetylase domain-containing protein n=1 Tax=Chitinimonas lacunae TaxID=1963018 RepID=A0ABV8MNK9_9NEIS
MVVRGDLPSPSARKPEQAVEAWVKAGLAIKVQSFAPVAQQDFHLAHQPRHVSEILNLSRRNGFDTFCPEVCATLPWTTGSMLAAARYALTHRTIACSPTSGFHHAGYETSWGFCTFNGLMVTARKLLQEGLVRRVGILDCDRHLGDGTEDIIARTRSRHQIVHFTVRAHYPDEAEGFFQALPGMLATLASCDLVLYQAGADVHVDDPLGGYLDSEQMRLRDRMVLSFLAERGVPTAWNLAGGYQEETLPDGRASLDKVLALHIATMEESLAAARGFRRRAEAILL